MPVEFTRQPAGLGQPLGRYSQIAVATGTQIVSVAGQVGITADGELAGDGGLAAQTWQTFANVATALAAAGLGTGDIFKTTTYLVGSVGMDDFMAARTTAFAEFFPSGQYPPNTLLVVSRLVEARFLVEVEALAIRAAAAG